MKSNQKKPTPSIFSDIFEGENYWQFLNDELKPLVSLDTRLPAANIKDTGKDFMIDMAVPGFDKEDFDITLRNNILTISAVVEDDEEEDDEKYTKREYQLRSFRRSFRLPEPVKSEDVKARYNNGLLELKIPKRDEQNNTNSRRIKIS